MLGSTAYVLLGNTGTEGTGAVTQMFGIGLMGELVLVLVKALEKGLIEEDGLKLRKAVLVLWFRRGVKEEGRLLRGVEQRGVARVVVGGVRTGV